MADRGRKRERVSGRRRAEERKASGGTNYVQLPEGASFIEIDDDDTRRFDIVPYVVTKGKDEPGGNPYASKGEEHYERTFWIHRGIGVDGEKVVCPKKTLGKPCPICEHIAKAVKRGDGDDDEVKDLLPKERQLWNVLDRDDMEKGVQVWDYSYHLFGKQLDQRVDKSDEDEGYEYFADPDDGSTLKIGWAEKKFGKHPYYEAVSIDFKRRKPLDDQDLEEAVNLDEALVVMDYDSLRKLFLEAEDDDSGGGSDSGDSGGRRRRRSEDSSSDSGGGRRRRRQSEDDGGGDDKGKGDDDPPADDGGGRRLRRRDDSNDDQGQDQDSGDSGGGRRRRRRDDDGGEDNDPPKDDGGGGRRRRRNRDEDDDSNSSSGNGGGGDRDDSDSPGADDNWDDWD